MKILALVFLTVLLAAGAADAATPAAYRANVNGICRGYTPTGKSLEAQMKKAQAAKDYVAWGVALGRLLLLDLEQDRRIEAVPVPAALTARMKTILTRMRTIDGHIRAAIADAGAGKSQAMLAELLKIGDLAKPLNAQLDAAGLKDCGSNQT
jgi:hypothetical protein